eukprot:Anaeramoba_flamelloidesa570689_24.p1 GENE.a570689_24~~a570689_24.p1  ORF type:complete len:225 (-),score=19.59 a570689_24:844-1518(-)
MQTQSTTQTYPCLLKANDLSHKFDYELFNNINLELYPKQSIAIIGTSGSGKSTLLNILSSLLKPSSGEVQYKDKNIYSHKKNELLKIRREDFGIIFQAHYLFRGFNASENLQIAELLSKNSVDQDLIKKLNIEHVMGQQIGELSGGQQQRLSIARVMTKKPNIIFADEPTGNLDKQTADEVMDVLFEYIKDSNSAMILVTHEEELAFRSDIVYRLENKELKRLK